MAVERTKQCTQDYAAKFFDRLMMKIGTPETKVTFSVTVDPGPSRVENPTIIFSVTPSDSEGPGLFEFLDEEQFDAVEGSKAVSRELFAGELGPVLTGIVREASSTATDIHVKLVKTNPPKALVTVSPADDEGDELGDYLDEMNFEEK